MKNMLESIINPMVGRMLRFNHEVIEMTDHSLSIATNTLISIDTEIYRPIREQTIQSFTSHAITDRT